MSIFNQNLKSPLEVKVEWVRNTSTPPLTLSISALMLNKDDVINKLEDFVFYGTPNNGSDIISSDKYLRSRLFSLSCLNSRMPQEDAKLIASIFMPKPSNQREIQIGYGVFIGYSGETPDATDTLGARLSREVHELERLIHERIEMNNLRSLELGFYFVPLNDPNKDKLCIVEEVLR